MVVPGILLSVAAIGFLCWLLFALAVYALPLLAGVCIATWAYHTGAGWFGAILAGVIGAGLIHGIGQVLLVTVRPFWARLLIAFAFVAPAAVAGYYATLGIVRHIMPSETWQMVFSIIGAIIVGITAYRRVTATATVPPSQGLAGAS